MKESNTRKVIKELFINDILAGLCFWSLVILVLMTFISLPRSLAIVLYMFFFSVVLVCLPFVIYKTGTAVRLAGKGVEIMATNISVEPGYFGKTVKFEYDYDGHRYHRKKYLHAVFFPEEHGLRLLVDADNPEKFVILDFRKKSVIDLVKERNS
jgi:hypothetical protein